MDVAKDFLDVLSSINEETLDEYYSVMDDIPETKVFISLVEDIKEKLEEDFEFTDEELGKIVLYFLGKKHGGVNDKE